jgi:hypothetical protein
MKTVTIVAMLGLSIFLSEDSDLERAVSQADRAAISGARSVKPVR